MKKYPRIQFRKKLKDLRKEIDKMGQVTIQSQKNATDALVNYDKELVNDVIKSGKEINNLAFNLERHCISIIAAEQPVASDLRFIEACIKVSSHLKRITQRTVDIAKTAELLKDEKLPKDAMRVIGHMADIVQMMLSKSIYAFLDQNMDMARGLRYDDDKVDDLFDEAMDHITKNMAKDNESISYMVYLLFVSRYLKRIADRAVSIGDRTIFMMTCEKP